MNLPSFDKNYFELDNAEDIHKKYPESFWIPEKAVRNNLKSGDIVKLIFRMLVKENPEEVEVERMWVEINEKEDGFYVGKLDNDPMGSVHVKCGQEVYFKPEHVIDVYEENT